MKKELKINLKEITDNTYSSKDIENWNKLRNQENFDSTSDRVRNNSRPKGLGIVDTDHVYHNFYRVNGKNNIGRTIKMSNKEWHRLNKTQSK